MPINTPHTLRLVRWVYGLNNFYDPYIITIARENELDDFSIFENSTIDTVFIPAKVLINKTVNAILILLWIFSLNYSMRLGEEKVIVLIKHFRHPCTPTSFYAQN
jgi:hypothetical protein